MGERTVTIREVAAAAGVSTATVSRTLAPDRVDGVSEATRLRVYAAAERTGYRTNYAARILKTRTSRTIGIVAPELANDFFMDLAEGMAGELEKRGYTLLVASSANSVEEEKKRVIMLAERMVDGMVVIPAGSEGGHLSPQALTGVPVVLVDRLVNGTDMDAVLSDNEGGAYELTRRLLADGFRRICFVGGDTAVSSARERIAGFSRAMTEAGLGLKGETIRSGGLELRDGYAGMGAILEAPNPPEALVAVNLLVHLGMERRLLEYRRPPGVALPVIAAFDESAYTPFLPACRYTAAQDAVTMGKEAVRRLLERIKQKKTAEKSPWTVSGPPGIEGKTGERIIRLPVTILRHQGELLGINA
ncbi:MAG: LacI family transcriptional regulator [Spirochaetaceae bacterium]|jgi:LacI family transcriptional regulator|nr:LacI family transcriptional regulator [Spirochaetaceae bacterium]